MREPKSCVGPIHRVESEVTRDIFQLTVYKASKGHSGLGPRQNQRLNGKSSWGSLSLEVFKQDPDGQKVKILQTRFKCQKRVRQSVRMCPLNPDSLAPFQSH